MSTETMTPPRHKLATKGFVTSGPASGVGKTTVTLAIMAALRRRGLTVQPFKCGPDFIDGGHHERICGRPSRNLDGWMLSADANRSIFYRAADQADVCIVEGMMGLFDGADGKSDAASTAEMAKSLQLPVILIVDASSIARSAAALVHGFETFDSALKVSGVIFNHVAGAAHYQLLKDALVNSKAAALGYFPRDERIHIPERYLGLFTAREDVLTPSAVGLLADLAEQSIDLQKLLTLAAPVNPLSAGFDHQHARSKGRAITVAVARDQAFCFYYEDNLDALRRAGAEITEFSPLADRCLPPRIDAVYLGGGYPEILAERLAENRGMLDSVKRAADSGLPIYAECGGLMYLANRILTKDGAFPMACVLPIDVRMTDKLVHFGYTEISFTSDCLLGRRGEKARGHSFHCSNLVDAAPVERVYRTLNPLTGREESEGLRVKNVLASYLHLHFLSHPRIAEAFVANVRRAPRAEPLISKSS